MVGPSYHIEINQEVRPKWVFSRSISLFLMPKSSWKVAEYPPFCRQIERYWAIFDHFYDIITNKINHLVWPDPNLTDIEYIHDPLGRRIAKIINGGITEKYLWQGLPRLLAVYDGSDNLLMRFLYADSRMPVAMEKGGATYYLTFDQVGSLRIVADAAGNVIKRIDYDSFGNITDDTNPSFEIPFGFAGGLQDRDTGLVRFGFRDYDPDVGRWTAKDPIGFWGGYVDLYGYCLNDPVNSIDPSGLGKIDLPPGERERRIREVRRRKELEKLKNIPRGNKEITERADELFGTPGDWGEGLIDDILKRNERMRQEQERLQGQSQGCSIK